MMVVSMRHQFAHGVLPQANLFRRRRREEPVRQHFLTGAGARRGQ
jgi:hypothetical protein